MNVINHNVVSLNGQQTATKRGTPQVKFVDTSYTASAVSVGAILAAGITNISQGVGVSQRTGDTVFYKQLFLNYTVNAANADIISSARIILFQWVPNSALIGPTVGSILQTTDIYSMYDWQLSTQYRILYDNVHFFAGTATDPASSSNQGRFNEISLARASRRAEFSPGATTGSNQLYILLISDSLIAPFPDFMATVRLTYSEE